MVEIKRTMFLKESVRYSPRRKMGKKIMCVNSLGDTLSAILNRKFKTYILGSAIQMIFVNSLGDALSLIFNRNLKA